VKYSYKSVSVAFLVKKFLVSNFCLPDELGQHLWTPPYSYVGQSTSVKGKCNKTQNEMNKITWHLPNQSSLTQICCQHHSIHYVTGQDASF